MSAETPDHEAELEKLIIERIGQDFEGECHLTDDEAVRIARLLREMAAENERLRGALKPFAEAARDLDGWPLDAEQPIPLLVRDLANALSALTKGKPHD